MRPLLIALALTLASTAYAQQGGVWYAGPYAPSRVAPTFNYYNPAGVTYPVSGNPFGRYYGDFATARELRRIRWAVEDSAHQTRWNSFSRKR